MNGKRKLFAFIISMTAFVVLGIMAIIYNGNIEYVGLGTAIMLISGPFYAGNAYVHIKGKTGNETL